MDSSFSASFPLPECTSIIALEQAEITFLLSLRTRSLLASWSARYESVFLIERRSSSNFLFRPPMPFEISLLMAFRHFHGERSV